MLYLNLRNCENEAHQTRTDFIHRYGTHTKSYISLEVFNSSSSRTLSYYDENTFSKFCSGSHYVFQSSLDMCPHAAHIQACSFDIFRKALKSPTKEIGIWTSQSFIIREKKFFKWNKRWSIEKYVHYFKVLYCFHSIFGALIKQYTHNIKLLCFFITAKSEKILRYLCFPLWYSFTHIEMHLTNLLKSTYSQHINHYWIFWFLT